MSFPNVSDIVATTLENRSGEVADNVTKNNALLYKLKKKGKIKTVSGGSQIFQELSFQENGNFGWYSGNDLLPVAAQDVISSAAFPFKQAACAIVVTGLELLQNSGKEEVLDLLENRIQVGEATMANNICVGSYSDGTGYGGKQITGFQAAVSYSPTTGVYGGIDRSVWPFWRNQLTTTGGVNPTVNNIQSYFTQLWISMVRGTDHAELILTDNNMFATYMGSLQPQQRFTDPELAQLGFTTVKFMTADVVLDGGVGGACPAWTAYFLNLNYLHYRPHKDRNMKPISPGRRAAINQDAEVTILGWAGNITCSGAQFQGVLKGF